jgi:hypothetical protein
VKGGADSSNRAHQRCTGSENIRGQTMAPRSAPQAPVDDALAAIPRLLNECQLSCAVHVRAAKTLGALRRAHPEAFSQRLTPCIQSLLLVPKVSITLCVANLKRISLPGARAGLSNLPFSPPSSYGYGDAAQAPGVPPRVQSGLKIAYTYDRRCPPM